MRMDRVLFGDNQFFGVNHMSEEKARAQMMRFQDLSAIMGVLDVAYQAGIHTFMCTTHERIREICDVLRKRRDTYPEFRLYPCMPYAHKYANAVTEYGLMEALRRFLPEDAPVRGLLKSGVSVARRDLEGLAKLLIDAEMRMFAGLPTPVIFMQNIVTDLLLGLGAHDAFRMFAEHIRSRYGAEPGFITMNLPRLLDVLEHIGLDNPIVCANINKIGFRMSGGIRVYEEAITTRRFRPVAMSIFASGAIDAREAVEYVAAQPRIESIVFGASSPANIRHTKSLIDACDRGTAQSTA